MWANCCLVANDNHQLARPLSIRARPGPPASRAWAYQASNPSSICYVATYTHRNVSSTPNLTSVCLPPTPVQQYLDLVPYDMYHAYDSSARRVWSSWACATTYYSVQQTEADRISSRPCVVQPSSFCPPLPLWMNYPAHTLSRQCSGTEQPACPRGEDKDRNADIAHFESYVRVLRGFSKMCCQPRHPLVGVVYCVERLQVGR